MYVIATIYRLLCFKRDENTIGIIPISFNFDLLLDFVVFFYVYCRLF